MKIREYIQVAPAAGVQPNPATYCPANGYVLDPVLGDIPVLALPASSEESILYICNGNFKWDNAHTHILSAGGSNMHHRFEVFDKDGNLLLTQLNGSTLFYYTFPTTDYYVVKFSPVAPYKILKTTSTHTSGYPGYCVESVIFNTPNLNAMNNAFLYSKGLVGVTFNSSCVNVTTMLAAFSYSGIRSFTFQSSYPILTTMSQMFLYAESLEWVKFPVDCYLPELLNINNFCGYSSVKKVEFASSMPKLTDISLSFQVTKRLESIVFWTDAPLITSTNAFCSSSNIGGTVTVPPMPLANTPYYFFVNCYRVKKIIFTGNCDNQGHLQDTLKNCTSLEEVEFTRTGGFTMYSCWGNNPVLKKVRTYDRVGITNYSMPLFPSSTGTVFEELWGDGDNSNATAGGYDMLASTPGPLKIIDLPKFRATKLSIGGAASPSTYLTTLNIDWANSPFTSTSAPQIFLNLPWTVAQLNALYALLPTVSAGQSCEFGKCTNWEGSDYLALIAKGWSPKSLSKVSTDDAITITRTTAVLGGNVYFGGGYAISGRGVCYGFTTNPITTGTKTSGTAGEGAFSATASSLTPNRLYYYRAYSTSSYGTAYGPQKTFTTLP
jgi:hypothetical protein